MNFNEELSDFWRFDLNDLVWESLTHAIEVNKLSNVQIQRQNVKCTETTPKCLVYRYNAKMFSVQIQRKNV